MDTKTVHKQPQMLLRVGGSSGGGGIQKCNPSVYFFLKFYPIS